MKKILLVGINAKYIHSNPAIYCLRAYTKQHYNQKTGKMMPNGSLELVEYTINQNTETILADIYQHKPDVAAFSCYIWNWNEVQDIITELPKLLPDIQIWLGGPEVSFHGEKILEKYEGVTGIMVGEGEAAFLDLFSYYQDNDDNFSSLEKDGAESRTGINSNQSESIKAGSLKSIKGILLRSGMTGERTPIDINDVPFIYTDEDMARFDNRILYYESQRGCPFRCAYCLSSIDKSIRIRDIDKVKEHLDFFLRKQVKQVKFIDRTFNCNKEYALEIWRYLLENDNGITNFHFEIAADILTDEQLEVMSKMRPGLIQLEIGVQTTNEETLKAINRYMDIEHLRSIVARINSFYNIHQHLDLIAGLPYEDYESFGHSFDDVYAMEPQQLQLGFLKVLKGSPIEDNIGKYGINYMSKTPYEVLYSKWLPYEDVRRLKGIEEMVELYYNSGQYAHTLPLLVSEFPSAFAMYESLSKWYEEKGYFTNVPSRSHHYQVLLDFACDVNYKRKDIYVQLLTFDLYLRENVKSRPAFATIWENKTSDCVNFHNDESRGGITGISTLKERIRNFYGQEAVQPLFLTGDAYKGCQPQQLRKMTHLERFEYPVWEKEPDKVTIPLGEPAYMLFDYQNRDPLTYNARYMLVEL